MFLCLWKNASFFVENPMTSLLPFHPRINAMLDHVKVFKQMLWMGAYGALTPKPTYIWSNNICVSSLGTAWVQGDQGLCVLSSFHACVCFCLMLASLRFGSCVICFTTFPTATPVFEVARRYIDVNGKRRVVGTPDLKSTQSRPCLGCGPRVLRTSALHFFVTGCLVVQNHTSSP